MDLDAVAERLRGGHERPQLGGTASAEGRVGADDCEIRHVADVISPSCGIPG
jgi:hypothetical protein